MRDFLAFAIAAIVAYGSVFLTDQIERRNWAIEADRSLPIPANRYPVRVDIPPKVSVVVAMPSCQECSVVSVDWDPIKDRRDVLLLFPDEASKREFRDAGRWTMAVRARTHPVWLWERAPAFYEVNGLEIVRPLDPMRDLNLKIRIGTLEAAR